MLWKKYLFLVITKITVMFQIVIYANLEIYAKNNITTRLLHYELFTDVM